MTSILLDKKRKGLLFLRAIDWSYRLYLDRKLYLAAIRLQADRKLSKSKAGLLALVEGLHNLGYLANADYEVYKNKYSVSLDEEANKLSPSEILRKETKEARYRQLNNLYRQVIAQWETLRVDVKYYHVKDAKSNLNLKYARKLVELAEQETLELTQK